MLYAIVGMLVIILDQGVKFWVTNHIPVDTVIQPLIPGVISLVRMHNDGAAFSFLAGGGARIYFIILTGIFAVAVILALATGFISGRFGRWCLVLVTAGGLSNCLDRILYGFVVDMFKVELFDFAIFNVADIFITVFCLLFIVYIIFGGEEKRPVEDEFDEDDEDLDRPSYKDSLKRERRQDKEDKAAARLAKRDKKRKAKYEEEEDEFSAAFMPKMPARGEAEAPVRGRKARAVEEEELPKKRAAMSREGRAQAAAPARSAAPSKKKSRYEEEYEAYMSSRPDARAELARSSAARAPQNDDPFAAWEQANAKAESRQGSSYTAKAMGVAKPAARPAADFEELAPRRPAAPAAAQPARRQARALPEYDEAPAEAPRRSAAAPARPAAPAPAPKAAPAAKADDGMEFSLDDILSEFR